MAGSVHQQKGADWWYVRKYHKGHYYSFSWYHGERMESERMALKLLGQIQGDIGLAVFWPCVLGNIAGIIISRIKIED